MEEYGYICFDKLSQFVTPLISRKNCPINLILNFVKYSDFLSILCSTSLLEHSKTKLNFGDRVRFWNYDSPLRMVHKLQLTQEALELLQFVQDNLQHTQ